MDTIAIEELQTCHKMTVLQYLFLIVSCTVNTKFCFTSAKI